MCRAHPLWGMRKGLGRLGLVWEPPAGRREAVRGVRGRDRAGFDRTAPVRASRWRAAVTQAQARISTGIQPPGGPPRRQPTDPAPVPPRDARMSSRASACVSTAGGDPGSGLRALSDISRTAIPPMTAAAIM